LVLAGHADGVNMIEVGAAEVPEKDMLEAIEFGHKAIKDILKLIDELVKKAGREKVMGELVLPPAEIMDKVKKVAEKEMTAARQIPGKHARGEAVDALRKKVL